MHVEKEYMKKIIIATTKSFLFAAENTEVKKALEERGYSIAFLERVTPPFLFDPKLVTLLVAGDSPLTGEMMAYFPNLSHIARFGVGFDCIDAAVAKKRGIIVTNVPAVSAREVAEHALSLLFSLAKDLPALDRRMKEGVWERTRHSSVGGKNLGIIGLGKIGKEMVQLAAHVGMRVGVFDRRYDEEFLRTVRVQKQTLAFLLSESDFISIHLPLVQSTHHLLNRDVLARIKPGAFLINTSRGEIIDEQALLDALDDGRVAGAGLDVFSHEPPFADPILQKLVAHPRVIATPHIASFSPEVQYAVARRVLKNILAVREGRMEETDRVI